MSWSAHIKGANNEDIRSFERPKEAPEDQFEAARSAAMALIKSGAFGDADSHRFHVSFSGHANPGHEPHPGWANDMVTVTLSQV